MKSLIENGPAFREAYDASTAEAHSYFDKVKEWLSAQDEDLATIDQQAAKFGDKALPFRTMLKFIESENAIRTLQQPTLLTLINPVYKETGRMQPRAEHPHGEDSLRTKIQCMRYFESLNSNFKGRIFVIDDDCPEGSGQMAEQILQQYPGSPHRVFFLGKAIDENDPDLPPGITHKDGQNRSVKGGAALFGMSKALQVTTDDLHIIVDNDADLSVHPMQLGLLIKDIAQGEAKAVIGSRREDDSVALIGESRNRRGSLFIKIWQYLLPELAKTINDTNRAFKGFESEALRKILPLIRIYTFPYQIELLQACISKGIPMVKKGIAYIDSEAASTQNEANITETYLNQIHQIMDIAIRYKTIPASDPLMNHLRSVSEEEWRKIQVNPPENLLGLLAKPT
ncbi:MAG: hypothetical protein OER04_18100 [Cyclobacteriaceae bacterium]|nr:hypothetical protein [Cyclobacteriaceae bacterium]